MLLKGLYGLLFLLLIAGAMFQSARGTGGAMERRGRWFGGRGCGTHFAWQSLV